MESRISVKSSEQLEGIQPILDEFSEETEALTKAIENIGGNVNIVDEKYKQSLGRHLTPAERTDASAQISLIVTQTSKTAQAVRKRLQRISDENEQFAKDYPNSSSALRVRVSTHQAITHNFMAAMQRLEDTQERHHDGVRASVERQLRTFNPDASEQDIQAALKRIQSTEGGHGADDFKLLCELPKEEQTKLRQQLDFLNCRNNDIRKLEHNILGLHQMFIDMQLLVDKQSDLLNNIEYNVQDTKVKAETGMKELIQAHDFQKKARRKKWCLAVIIVIILTVICVPILVKYAPIWFSTADDGNTDTSGGVIPTASVTPQSDGSPLPETLPIASRLQSDAAIFEHSRQPVNVLML